MGFVDEVEGKMALTRYKSKHKVLVLGWCRLYNDVLQVAQSGEQTSGRARFSTPIQTGHGTDITPYTMGTGSFYVVKGSVRGVNPTPTHLTPRLNKD